MKQPTKKDASAKPSLQQEQNTYKEMKEFIDEFYDEDFIRFLQRDPHGFSRTGRDTQYFFHIRTVEKALGIDDYMLNGIEELPSKEQQKIHERRAKGFDSTHLGKHFQNQPIRPPIPDSALSRIIPEGLTEQDIQTGAGTVILDHAEVGQLSYQLIRILKNEYGEYKTDPKTGKFELGRVGNFVSHLKLVTTDSQLHIVPEDDLDRRIMELEEQQKAPAQRNRTVAIGAIGRQEVFIIEMGKSARLAEQLLSTPLSVDTNKNAVLNVLGINTGKDMGIKSVLERAVEPEVVKEPSLSINSRVENIGDSFTSPEDPEDTGNRSRKQCYLPSHALERLTEEVISNPKYSAHAEDMRRCFEENNCKNKYNTPPSLIVDDSLTVEQHLNKGKREHQRTYYANAQASYRQADALAYRQAQPFLSEQPNHPLVLRYREVHANVMLLLAVNNMQAGSYNEKDIDTSIPATTPESEATCSKQAREAKTYFSTSENTAQYRCVLGNICDQILLRQGQLTAAEIAKAKKRHECNPMFEYYLALDKMTAEFVYGDSLRARMEQIDALIKRLNDYCTKDNSYAPEKGNLYFIQGISDIVYPSVEHLKKARQLFQETPADPYDLMIFATHVALMRALAITGEDSELEKEVKTAATTRMADPYFRGPLTKARHHLQPLGTRRDPSMGSIPGNDLARLPHNFMLYSFEYDRQSHHDIEHTFDFAKKTGWLNGAHGRDQSEEHQRYFYNCFAGRYKKLKFAATLEEANANVDEDTLYVWYNPKPDSGHKAEVSLYGVDGACISYFLIKDDGDQQEKMSQLLADDNRFNRRHIDDMLYHRDHVAGFAKQIPTLPGRSKRLALNHIRLALIDALTAVPENDRSRKYAPPKLDYNIAPPTKDIVAHRELVKDNIKIFNAHKGWRTKQKQRPAWVFLKLIESGVQLEEFNWIGCQMKAGPGFDAHIAFRKTQRSLRKEGVEPYPWDEKQAHQYAAVLKDQSTMVEVKEALCKKPETFVALRQGTREAKKSNPTLKVAPIDVPSTLNFNFIRCAQGVWSDRATRRALTKPSVIIYQSDYSDAKLQGSMLRFMKKQPDQASIDKVVCLDEVLIIDCDGYYEIGFYNTKKKRYQQVRIDDISKADMLGLDADIVEDLGLREKINKFVMKQSGRSVLGMPDYIRYLDEENIPYEIMADDSALHTPSVEEGIFVLTSDSGPKTVVEDNLFAVNISGKKDFGWFKSCLIMMRCHAQICIKEEQQEQQEWQVASQDTLDKVLLLSIIPIWPWISSGQSYSTSAQSSSAQHADPQQEEGAFFSFLHQLRARQLLDSRGLPVLRSPQPRSVERLRSATLLKPQSFHRARSIGERARAAWKPTSLFAKTAMLAGSTVFVAGSLWRRRQNLVSSKASTSADPHPSVPSIPGLGCD